jgi:hypothetical protein
VSSAANEQPEKKMRMPERPLSLPQRPSLLLLVMLFKLKGWTSRYLLHDNVMYVVF